MPDPEVVRAVNSLIDDAMKVGMALAKQKAEPGRDSFRKLVDAATPEGVTMGHAQIHIARKAHGKANKWLTDPSSAS